MAEKKQLIRGTDTWIDAYEKLAKIKDKKARQLALTNFIKTNKTLSVADKRKLQSKFTYDKVKKDINNVKNIVDIPPLFLKPAYFLQQATPFISGVIKVSQGEESGKEEIELCSPEEDTNNIVKSFEYDVATNKAIIIVGNAEEYVIEFLAMKVGSLIGVQPPIVELEYGWASPKATFKADISKLSANLNNNSNYTSRVNDTVYFRNKFLAVINDMEVSYEQNGSITLTITCTKDYNFPPPLQNFNPYDILGKKPAVVLQQIQTLQQLAFYFGAFGINKDESYFLTEGKDENTILRSIIEYFYFYKQIKNILSIYKAIIAAQQFYRPDLNPIFKLKSKVCLFIQAYSKDLIGYDKKVWSRVNNNKIDIRNDLFTKYKGKILKRPIVNGKNKKTIPLTPIKSMIDKSSKKILTSTDSKFAVIKSFLKNYENTLIDTHLSIRKELKEAGPHKNGIPNYYVYLKKLYIALTPLLDEALIHPYSVLIFSKELFKEQLKAFQKKASKQGNNETAKQIMLTKHYEMLGFDKEMVAGYSQSVDKSKQGEFENVEFYDYENEKYLKKSGAIAVLTPTSSWGGLYATLASEMYIWVEKEEYETTSKQTSGKKFDKQRKIENLSKKNDKEALLRAIANCQLMQKKEALSSLEIFKTIMEDRQNFQKNIGDKTVDSKTLKNITDAITSIKKLDEESFILLTIFDTIPGIDSFFDPLRGKQSIHQAYSVRGGGFLNEVDQSTSSRFNIGYPSVFQINFPDVLSFNPKINLMANINQINNALNTTSADLKTQKKELTTELISLNEQLKTLAGKSNKTKREVIEKNKKSIEANIQSLSNTIKIRDIYQSGQEFKRPVDMIFPNRKNSTAITKASQLQEKRKYIQEYRKKAILYGASIDVEMEVLGDSSFGQNSLGKYLFIKKNNSDGEDSFFTGIYNIKTIKHKISAGVFTTSFELFKDPTVNTDIANQIKQVAYYSDDI